LGVQEFFLYIDILLALACFLHLSLIYDINLHCHLLTMCKYLDLTLAARPRALPVGRNPLAVGNDPRNQSRFEALVVSPQPTSYLGLTLITDCSSTNLMSTISSTTLSPPPSTWIKAQEWEHFRNIKQAEHEVDAILEQWARERELELSLMMRLREIPQVLRNNVTLNHDQAELEPKL